MGAGMTFKSAIPKIKTTNTGQTLKMKALSKRWYKPK